MADTVSRIYSNFRGVDFRGEEINFSRSPDALNMWKDYTETESIRTRPGLSKTGYMPSGSIYGIYFYKDFMIIHRGSSLIKRTPLGTASIREGVNSAKSRAFVYDGIWYFMDGINYFQYDGITISEVVGYIPITTIARKPYGGGTKHEDVNMLSDYRINTFLADGMNFDFYLDTMNIDNDFTPEVYTIVNGEEIPASDITVDYAEGKISFSNTAPDAPDTDGQDNVKIKFKKAVPEYRAAIMQTTLLQVFDNRIFVSGNSHHPNYIWHSSLNDPSYFSDLDYYMEGTDEAAVKGLVAGNNALWVFREASDSNTTVFYHTPTIDDEYGKIYPSVHSSISTGCVGAAVNFNDDIVFFSDRGMEGISGDVTTEQVIAHRSTLVDRKLIAEVNYQHMVLAEWEGYLLVFIGDKVYLADSRAMLQIDTHMEYEWFYWELDVEVTCACVNDGELYVGTNNGLYILNINKNLPCYWTTPKDKFKNPNRLKTTNKRGCVAEATGDIKVSAKVEDSEFETIGEYTGVTDYFVSRIKRKKFKDIQLKFASNTRFSLETVTLECFIGGYIKR